MYGTSEAVLLEGPKRCTMGHKYAGILPVSPVVLKSLATNRTLINDLPIKEGFLCRISVRHPDKILMDGIVTNMYTEDRCSLLVAHVHGPKLSKISHSENADCPPYLHGPLFHPLSRCATASRHLLWCARAQWCAPFVSAVALSM